MKEQKRMCCNVVTAETVQNTTHVHKLKRSHSLLTQFKRLMSLLASDLYLSRFNGIGMLQAVNLTVVYPDSCHRTALNTPSAARRKWAINLSLIRCIVQLHSNDIQFPNGLFPCDCGKSTGSRQQADTTNQPTIILRLSNPSLIPNAVGNMLQPSRLYFFPSKRRHSRNVKRTSATGQFLAKNTPLQQSGASLCHGAVTVVQDDRCCC